MRCYRAPSAPFSSRRRYHSAFIWLPRTIHTAQPHPFPTPCDDMRDDFKAACGEHIRPLGHPLWVDADAAATYLFGA